MAERNDLNQQQSASSSKASLDLEKVVTNYAWHKFYETRKLKHRFLKFDDLDFEINFDKVQFISDEPVYKKLTPPQPRSVNLFETTFENKTEKPQNYNFQTSRTTTSTISVDVETGVTTGYELSLTLKIPGDIIEAGAGFSKEKTITTTRSESAEETLTWGSDSQVQVQSNTVALVKLTVDEKTDTRCYDIKSYLYGPVNVTVKRKKDNKPLKHYGGFIEKIVEEKVNPAQMRQLRMEIDKTKKKFPHTVVTYHSTGNVKFKYAVQQQIQIREGPIKKDESGRKTSQV